MGDRFLECGATERLVARLAPPFDRQIVESSLGEMMRDRFRIGGMLGVAAQDFGRAPMQRLPAALQQAVVGGVLDQRMFEAIVRLRRRALDIEQVGFGKPSSAG